MPNGVYNELTDCRFYAESPVEGSAAKLGADYFAVVFPDDAHIPELVVGDPREMKKVVVKVPMVDC